jgi:phosphatidyl-myo-inositol alpha-mannosyltransferase
VRISLVCPYAFDDPGGVQTHVRELAEYLLEQGHAVEALAPLRGRERPAYLRPVGRPVDVPYNASNAPIDPRPWSRRAVAAALRAFGPDVVHVHEPLAPSTSMWATLEARAPVVATFHSGAERSRLYDLAAPVLRRVARRIVVRVAVSETAAAFARARIGDGFEIVPNGADVERFVRATPAGLGEGLKLLFVGRLDERKGFPVAVAAFGSLAPGRPDLRLVVVGEGPQRSAVDALPAVVRDRVLLVGAVPNVDLPPYGAACDLYVGSAVGGESFGMVLVEAMAAGLPVVASRIPGYMEVVRDGIDGLLVPPRDPEALAGAIARVLDDRELAARLMAAGRERALTFDWSIVGARLLELYGRAAVVGPASLR